MTDKVLVQPLRTFDAGYGLKTVESEPFLVESGLANELKERKLVEIVGKTTDDSDIIVVDEPDAAAEPEPVPVVEPDVDEPAKPGRKPKAATVGK